MHKSVYRYDYRRSRDQETQSPVRHAVVIVGAGPVGLAACRLIWRKRGVSVVLLDDSDRIGEGSRGICWSKRTLEILDRLGVGERLVARGVTWKLGKVFCGDDAAVRDSTCCLRKGTRCPPSSTCSSFIWRRR
jgi:3-(3-hydroxy-phenyl)propionate hydroxylase